MPTICSIQHLLSKMLPQHTKRTTKFNSIQFNYFYNNFYSTKFFFRCDILNAIASVYCERERKTLTKKNSCSRKCVTLILIFAQFFLENFLWIAESLFCFAERIRTAWSWRFAVVMKRMKLEQNGLLFDYIYWFWWSKSKVIANLYIAYRPIFREYFIGGGSSSSSSSSLLLAKADATDIFFTVSMGLVAASFICTGYVRARQFQPHCVCVCVYLFLFYWKFIRMNFCLVHMMSAWIF